MSFKEKLKSKEKLKAIKEYFSKEKFERIGYPQIVEEFEKKFSSYHDCQFGIGVGNGTDAITVALKALGVTKNSEVITTSNTAIPTVTGIVNEREGIPFSSLISIFIRLILTI